MTRSAVSTGPSVMGVAPADLTGREQQLRSAASVMASLGLSFSRLARRSLPFIARYRSSLRALPPGILDAGGLDALVGPAPSYFVELSATKGRGWAAVGVNSSAIAVLLEGSLGGSALFDSAPIPTDLTGPQKALVDRVTRNLAQDLAETLTKEANNTFAVNDKQSNSARSPQAATPQGMSIVCEFEGLAVPAAIVIGVSAEALASSLDSTTALSGEADPRMVEAVQDVPLELIAELGRVSMPLRQALAFAVGDVIRLRTATEDSIRVCIAGTPKFDAIPVTSRGQMAIEIQARHSS